MAQQSKRYIAVIESTEVPMWRSVGRYTIKKGANNKYYVYEGRNIYAARKKTKSYNSRGRSLVTKSGKINQKNVDRFLSEQFGNDYEAISEMQMLIEEQALYNRMSKKERARVDTFSNMEVKALRSISAIASLEKTFFNQFIINCYLHESIQAFVEELSEQDIITSYEWIANPEHWDKTFKKDGTISKKPGDRLYLEDGTIIEFHFGYNEETSYTIRN